jgi:hypothetical protein
MSVNRTARQFWLEEPLRGEVKPGARYEMLNLSRLMFDKDWIDAAVSLALQKHQEAIRKALDKMQAVHRSCVFISNITPNLVGISYVTHDGRRANVFCPKDEETKTLMGINQDKGIEVVYCDRYR